MKPFLDGNFHLLWETTLSPSREYKRYRKMWNTYPKVFRVPYFPIHLDIELNTNCNLRCPSCFQSFDTPETKLMPMRMVKQIIDIGTSHGLCSIKFNYRGEPLLYPKLVEVVKYAKYKGIIEIMFNTNGYLLDINKSYQLVMAGLDKIIFSIDDHRPKEYAKLRVGSALEVVENNIRNLIVIREFHKKSNPLIRIQKIDREVSRHLNEEYIEHYKKMSDIIAMHEYLDYRCKETDSIMPKWCCASLWQRMLILADGTISPCCGLNANIVKLGNIKTDSIRKLWHGEFMTAFRSRHREGCSHDVPMCRSCALRLHYLSMPQYL